MLSGSVLEQNLIPSKIHPSPPGAISESIKSCFMLSLFFVSNLVVK